MKNNDYIKILNEFPIISFSRTSLPQKVHKFCKNNVLYFISPFPINKSISLILINNLLKNRVEKFRTLVCQYLKI